MELFASNHGRLAFLPEIDAALDLDFETLEAQARDASGEEPAELHQQLHRLEGGAGRLDLEAHARRGVVGAGRLLRLGGRGLHVQKTRGLATERGACRDPTTTISSRV